MSKPWYRKYFLHVRPHSQKRVLWHVGEEFSHHLLIESLSKCETSSLVPLISYIVFLNGLGTKSRKKDMEYAGKIEIKKGIKKGMCAWNMTLVRAAHHYICLCGSKHDDFMFYAELMGKWITREDSKLICQGGGLFMWRGNFFGKV